MKSIKTKCKQCNTSIEQDGIRSMKRCKGCGIKWGFTINIDNSVHLFQNGAKKKPDQIRKKPVAFSWSDELDEKVKKAGYTRQQVLEFGYNTLVLGIDKITAISIIR